jgi:2'-5' RNA ligase
MIRLFVVIEFPDDVQHALAGLCAGVPGARWTPTENLHLTLRFIGDIDEGTADDVHDALLGVRAPAFDLVIAGVDHFSSGPEVRVLWAGIARNPALDQLQRTVDSALRRIGLPPEERRWKPHVTLARMTPGTSIPRVQAFLAGNALFRAGPFAVRAFSLFSSHRRADAAIYTAEASYPLSHTAL